MIRHLQEPPLHIKIHGLAPYQAVLIHGGPGAAGEMAPLAVDLAANRGILEPHQTASSVAGQVSELISVIEQWGDPPVVLVGFSWGAWLSLLVAAKVPSLVDKLILIGCGPFEERYTVQVLETRMNRLNDGEKAVFIDHLMTLSDPESENKDSALAALGALVAKTDYYDPTDEETEIIQYRGDIFQKVWEDAAEMRRTGELLDLLRNILCPVLCIHGDYDPHPAAGVQPQLAAAVKDCHFILLEKCGHKPWIERQARDKFLRILKEELSPSEPAP